MTLLVGIAHPQYALLLSDRLLTALSNSKAIAQSTKEGVLQTDDATVLYAYTGLATAGAYETGAWLARTLQDAGKGGATLHALLPKAAELATQTFFTNPDVKKLTRQDQRLFVMMVGFTSDGRIVYGDFANCTNPETGKWVHEANDEFRWGLATSKDMSTRPSLIRWQGTTNAIASNDFDELDKFVTQGKPISAVIGKAVTLMRSIADRSASGGRIGRDILVGSLTMSPLRWSSQFIPDGRSASLYFMDRVDVRSNGDHLITIGATFTSHGGLFVDPIAGRRKPCPCGSGKQFRKCHGKR